MSKNVISISINNGFWSHKYFLTKTMKRSCLTAKTTSSHDSKSLWWYKTNSKNIINIFENNTKHYAFGYFISFHRNFILKLEVINSFLLQILVKKISILKTYLYNFKTINKILIIYNFVKELVLNIKVFFSLL